MQAYSQKEKTAKPKKQTYLQASIYGAVEPNLSRIPAINTET